MIEELINSYSTKPNLLWISAFAFSIGYLEYIYSFRLVLRERCAPYPVWMHTFYFAHDLTAAIVFFNLARQHDYFWFFTGASIGMVIWNCFEIFNLYMAIKVERQEIWGKFYDTPVSVGQALGRVVGQIALMLVVVNLFRVFMDDVVMFKWFAFTNILIAVAPGYLWSERRSRRGASVGLALVILVGTVNTFLPPGYGMWTTALAYFNQPWFYLTGVVVSAFALRNLVMLWRFPEKPAEGGRPAIW
ncbi:hypothetical protein FQZ97_838380 [compost metagenome]